MRFVRDGQRRETFDVCGHRVAQTKLDATRKVRLRRQVYLPSARRASEAVECTVGSATGRSGQIANAHSA